MCPCGSHNGAHAGWCSAEACLTQPSTTHWRVTLALQLHLDACAMWVDALRQIHRGDLGSAAAHFGWAEEAADKALACVGPEARAA